MFTIKKLPKNLSKPLKLLKNKYPKTCSTLSMGKAIGLARVWLASDFHCGFVGHSNLNLYYLRTY